MSDTVNVSAEVLQGLVSEVRRLREKAGEPALSSDAPAAPAQGPAFKYEPGMFDGMSAADARAKMAELWKTHGGAR